MTGEDKERTNNITVGIKWLKEHGFHRDTRCREARDGGKNAAGGEVMFHELKEMPITPWVYEEVRREDGSLMTARIYTSDDARECFICEDEAMLPQMMRDFWTSVGRRGIKCE